MKKSFFSQRFVVLLLCSTLGWWSSVNIWAAMDKRLNAPSPSNDPTAVEAIKQIQQDMGNGMVAADLDKISALFADDWAAVGMSGRIMTKQDLLVDFKSGGHRLTSFAIGPLDIQVFGNVAMVQGSVTEKRTDAGKDTSGEFVYMDILKKREGKWVVVRSQNARVK
jgi:ketosteroid isomerase-like protein